MSWPMRILITGFEPFPGAPFNPTPRLVRHLMRWRSPALDGVERHSHIFPVTYGAVDQQLPELLTAYRPDALLMFGLAARTPHIRVEFRARNAITQLWPDAGHTRIRHGKISPGGPAALPFGRHIARMLQGATNTGVNAALSRDAGRYLCNYLSWRAIEATKVDRRAPLVSFIHVPLVPRDNFTNRHRPPSALDFDDLTQVGTALLTTIVTLARQRRLTLATD